MKTNSRKEQVYLTKRALKRTSRKAITRASKRAMRVAGYVVQVQNGWVVRIYKDNKVERIEQLSPKVKPQEVVLD